jgi:integrase
MRATDWSLAGPWLRRFLLEHLIVERNLSRHTQRSYRDTIRLLLPFAATRLRRPIDRLTLTDLSAPVLRDFLQHLERERRCGVRTRNQRLAAVHAFAYFVGERDPEWLAWCRDLRSVPFKRYDRPALAYLEKAEIDALLAAPDPSTDAGRRATRSCSFSITAARGPARPPASRSTTSTATPTAPGPSVYGAKAARPDIVHSGRPQCACSAR